MGKKYKRLLLVFAVFAVSFSLFLGLGYVSLNKDFSKASTEKEKVPYTQEKPQNAGILFDINGEETFFFLNFEECNITVALNPEEPINNEIFGYSLDYKITANSDLLSEITDYLNGLELTILGEDYRYTGQQIKALIESDNTKRLRYKIIDAIFNRIVSNGVATDFFGLIIKKSETNLNLVDCYFWSEYLTELSKNLRYIDY